MTTPRRPVDAWDDPELASLFEQEPELYELSRAVKAARPEPQVGPHFQPYLRARLMDAAARDLRPRGLRRLGLRPGVFAGGGAALGVAMIAAVVVATVMYRPHDSRVDLAYTNVAENHDVSPDDVIRVAFTQDVDHAAVEHNLQIHPATTVQTRWESTTLVITPVHRLAANTPYTVTIPRAAVRGQNGVVAQADIHIAFGTKATPTPGPAQPPAQPPALQAVALGPVNADSTVVLAPDGSVVATAGLVEPTPSPSASSSPGGGTGSLLPSLLPGILPSASPTVSPAATAVAHLAKLSSTGPTVLGPAARAAAYSPSGTSIAYLVARSNVADLWVAKADGSSPARLVRGTDATSPLAWSGEDTLLYLSGGQVSAVDLQGRTRAVSGGLRVVSGQDDALAPGGQFLYVGPVPAATSSPSASPSASASASASTSASATASASPSPSGTPSPDATGRLVDLGTGTVRPLNGIRHLPAFSADGSRVAWVDESGTTPLLQVARTAADPTAGVTTVSTAAQSGDGLGTLALSGDGSRIVYTLSHGSATPALKVVSVTSGETVAVGDGQPVQSPVLSTTGDRIAFLRAGSNGTQAEQATVPGVPTTAPPPDAVPADATLQLDRFVNAQLANGDHGALRALGVPSLNVSDALTPGSVTRSYVIKATLDRATGQVTAQVRLVRDASHDVAASFADETIKLDRAAGGPYLVSVAAISDFRTEPNGPQIVHVTSERQGGALVVRMLFDSDLDPATVTGSGITLTADRGSPLVAQVSYEVESRTVVVRVADVRAGTLTLAVSGALRDIAGQPLATAYSTTLQG